MYKNSSSTSLATFGNVNVRLFNFSYSSGYIVVSPIVDLISIFQMANGVEHHMCLLFSIVYSFLAELGLSCGTQDLCYARRLLSSCGFVEPVVAAGRFIRPKACGILVPWWWWFSR